MMQECLNKEHDDKNANENGANINNMNQREETCPYITSLDMILECEDKKTHNNKMIMRQKPAYKPWIRKQKNTQISHPQL